MGITLTSSTDTTSTSASSSTSTTAPTATFVQFTVTAQLRPYTTKPPTTTLQTGVAP
jgi:hypothetical protein